MLFEYYCSFINNDNLYIGPMIMFKQMDDIWRISIISRRVFLYYTVKSNAIGRFIWIPFDKKLQYYFYIVKIIFIYIW